MVPHLTRCHSKDEELIMREKNITNTVIMMILINLDVTNDMTAHMVLL